MKITIDFGHPYFEEEVLLGLTQDDLNCFYADASEVDRLNLFFVLEASLHRFQGEERMKTAAYCAFLMAYYLFIALTPPAQGSWFGKRRKNKSKKYLTSARPCGIILEQSARTAESTK